MEAFIIKGIETSWLDKLLHNFYFLIPLFLISGLSILFIDVTLYFLVFLIILCKLHFVLSFFRIEISDTKISVKKYFLGICIERGVFERQKDEEFVEHKGIFEIISGDYIIKIFKHDLHDGIDDELWISFKTDSSDTSIRTISEMKTIEYLDLIKHAIKQTIK